MLAASDAAEDETKKDSGDFHLVFLEATQDRQSFVAVVDDSLYNLFQESDHHIAQLELALILYGLLARPAEFRGRRGIWFVDNTAALMLFIRGRSSSPDLERLSQVIHLCLFTLSCTPYWEWIPSKSNWAEDISRLGWRESWPVANGFRVYPSFIFPLLALGAALRASSPRHHSCRAVPVVHWE